MYKRISLIMALLSITFICRAKNVVSEANLEQLVEMAAQRTLDINDDCILELVVTSSWNNPNKEVNPNRTHIALDTTRNTVTAYAQTLDGSKGLRLQFDEGDYNRLSRHDMILLNLKGSTISCENGIKALTVSRLTPRNVISLKKGSSSDIVNKYRTISELSDEDVYTEVTLTSVEFVFKAGTFADIQETYSIRQDKYHTGYKSVHNRMDCWPTAVRDANGGVIYMLVNSLCDWRRDGDGVPAGSGEMTGIVVSSHLRRFGESIGRYSIRPLSREDIAISAKKSTTLWTPLTGYYTDGLAGQTLTFLSAGEVEDVNKKNVKNDMILNDFGAEAYLWSDSGAKMGLTSDYNSLTADTETKGLIKNGAIQFTTPLNTWYEFDDQGKVTGTKAVYLEFTAKKAKGTKMQLSFDIAAGNGDMKSCHNFPYEWKVEYSLDAVEWQVLPDAVTGKDFFAVRTVPTWTKSVDDKKYPTQYDCGFGLQQHVFNIPSEAMGKNKVHIRITPASSVLTAIHVSSDKSSRDKSDGSNFAKPTNSSMTYIRFGTIRVDYR